MTRHTKHTCHECGGPIEYPEQVFGESVNCSHCGQENTLGEIYRARAATAQPGSEVEKECRPRLEAAWATLTQALALQGEETWQAEAKKQRRNLLLAAVGALIVVGAFYILPGEDRAPFVGVLFVVGAFYFGIQQMRRAAKEQDAEAKALAEKRLEWTGKAMQRAGMKAETVKRTLTQGGTVVAWGDNEYGQTTVPAGLSGVVAIAAGGLHTVALKLPK